ncbi:MAG: 2-C-methyl-D-erythritol 2,4-cyclodiphosphate synthase [Rikenellaceae bacterium]
MRNIRIGYGYDVHRLAEGLSLTIGGIKLEHTKGCVAHSDGDVLIHAICDAMLGALALGDIGTHFPDTSAEFKNIDSKILLKRTVELIEQKGYEVGNVDSMLCLENPKIKPHVKNMQATLAAVIGVDDDDVSIKATTKEKLGFVGEERGVEASAVVLLFKKEG